MSVDLFLAKRQRYLTCNFKLIQPLMYCVYISGPSVVGANSAAVTSDAFGGTASLRERLARPLITTSATSSTGKERKGLSEKVSSAMLILFTDNQGTSFD